MTEPSKIIYPNWTPNRHSQFFSRKMVYLHNKTSRNLRHLASFFLFAPPSAKAHSTLCQKNKKSLAHMRWFSSENSRASVITTDGKIWCSISATMIGGWWVPHAAPSLPACHLELTVNRRQMFRGNKVFFCISHIFLLKTPLKLKEYCGFEHLHFSYAVKQHEHSKTFFL